MNDSHVSVEEAARLLGVSVASIRRKCAQGEVKAEKVGRAWVIERASLPAVRQRARPPRRSAMFDLDTALLQLRHRDFTELWIPDILRFEDTLTDPATLKAEAAQRLDSLGPFDPVVQIHVPKDALFFRAASSLSLPDRLAYHACVLALAPEIERRRLPSTFAANTSPDKKYLLKSGVQGFLNWKRAVSDCVSQADRWLLSTDIVAFFDNIQLRQLFSNIDALGPPTELSSALKRMLGDWTQNTNVGIPQGPDASRLLGNHYLLPVDIAMSRGTWHYYRYMDDIAIVGDTKADAQAGIRVLQTELRKLSLSLATKKTKLLHGDKALQSLAEPALDKAQYAFDARAKNARDLLKSIFRKSLAEEGNVNPRWARFSLHRLRTKRDSGVLSRTLSRLEDLAPIAQIVAGYLIPFLERRSVERRLGEFFNDNARNTSDYLSTWLLATALHHSGPLPQSWLEYARRVAQDRNEPTYHRVFATNVLALSRDTTDIDWVKRELRGEFDPTLVRGFVIALARARSLDGATEASTVKRHPQLQLTIDYLKGRSRLPSPVWAEQFTTTVTS